MIKDVIDVGSGAMVKIAELCLENKQRINKMQTRIESLEHHLGLEYHKSKTVEEKERHVTQRKR